MLFMRGLLSTVGVTDAKWLLPSLKNSTKRWLSSSSTFEQAQIDLKKVTEEPDVSVKLELYALFKQATLGDASGKRPGVLDFAGRAKFDAWNNLKGTAKETAEQKYADIIASLLSEQVSSSTTCSFIEGIEAVPGLAISKQGKVFRIELDRPDKYNAINVQMYEGLTAALNYASNDPTTTLTVLSGRGEYYSAGNDLKNFLGATSPEEIAKLASTSAELLQRFVSAFIEHNKPLVALVNGPAIGITVTTLPLCDVVLASDSATFHTPFAALGQSAEGCSSYTFPMLMGPLKAAETLIFGRKLSAHEALERNLVNEVIAKKEFETETTKRIEQYAALPPESLQLNKQLLRSEHKARLLECNRREVILLEQRWLSKECHTAVASFLSRKK